MKLNTLTYVGLVVLMFGLLSPLIGLSLPSPIPMEVIVGTQTIKIRNVVGWGVPGASIIVRVNEGAFIYSGTTNAFGEYSFSYTDDVFLWEGEYRGYAVMDFEVSRIEYETGYFYGGHVGDPAYFVFDLTETPVDPTNTPTPTSTATPTSTSTPFNNLPFNTQVASMLNWATISGLIIMALSLIWKKKGTRLITW